jgi:diacylglycerol kinase (ATP)
LARTLGIPADPVLAADFLFENEPIPMDAVRYRCSSGDGYSLNIAGVGFDASVAQRINDGFRFLKGTTAYLAAVLQCLASYRPVRLTIAVDGETFETSAMLCAVANARYYGGGMKIAPNASVDDGLIDVVVVGGISKPEFLRQFPRVFKGTHLSHPAVKCLRGRTVRIDSSEPIPVLADGEIVGLPPAEFEIVPGTVKVVMGKA